LFFIVNAHSLNLAYGDPGYHAALKRADQVVRDGIGIELAGKVAKRPFGYNFIGTDLIPRLFKEAQQPLRVFFYGATATSNQGAQSRIARDFPHITVVGGIDGFVPVEQAIEAIRASQADLLLVATGQPKQELFLDQHRKELGVKLGVGVGALFDFLSGEVARAPEWVLKSKSEWIYRLFREPRRMFSRYVVGNPKFLWRVFRSRRSSQT
jgi:exopolysaccharide biosynthesis WecB/TagA/CpsF family protein